MHRERGMVDAKSARTRLENRWCASWLQPSSMPLNCLWGATERRSPFEWTICVCHLSHVPSKWHTVRAHFLLCNQSTGFFWGCYKSKGRAMVDASFANESSGPKSYNLAHFWLQTFIVSYLNISASVCACANLQKVLPSSGLRKRLKFGWTQHAIRWRRPI